MANRPTAQRIQDAKQRLATEPNVWVATASSDGNPHLVPLSLAWIDEQIVVATAATTATARNASESGQARLSLDSADDVLMIDAAASVSDLAAASDEIMTQYIDRVGWDPRNESGEWSLITLTSQRIQAWIGPAEIADRTIMRNGEWLDS